MASLYYMYLRVHLVPQSRTLTVGVYLRMRDSVSMVSLEKSYFHKSLSMKISLLAIPPGDG